MPKRLKPLSGLGDTILRTGWFFLTEIFRKKLISAEQVPGIHLVNDIHQLFRQPICHDGFDVSFFYKLVAGTVALERGTVTKKVTPLAISSRRSAFGPCRET